MQTRLIYSPNYNFGILGLEKLHAFDAKKFHRAWSLLTTEWGERLNTLTTFVFKPVTDEQLRLVHSADYLRSLSRSDAVARVIEISALRFLPQFILKRGLLTPAKWATAGTLEAARQALTGCVAYNLGGGFHHAFSDHGEGFCFYADAAFALETLKSEGKIANDDQVLMIDLDAHRGNGFTSFYEQDKNVGIFDLYNMQVYPGLKPGDPDEFPFIIPMRAGLGSADYLDLVRTELPQFLDVYSKPKIAFYNAGTDVVVTDKLGGLNVSYQAVNERDRFVIDALRERNIPTVIMTSGGYSDDSYKLIADLASYLIRTDA